MELVSLILQIIIIIILITVIIIFLNRRNQQSVGFQQIEQLQKDLQRIEERLHSDISDNLQSSMRNISEIIGGTQRDNFLNLENRFKTFEVTNEQKLDNIRTTMEINLANIREDGNRRLEDMRATVDEKLQKTLEEKMTQSFQLVNERLEQVYKGLGEMQTLAVGVGDLKKVLNNVKTRGILGELQLKAILEEILTPEQYESNVAVIPASANRVEFAIKLPAEDDSFIYLPIDAKFPGDSYSALQDAYESGSVEAINRAVARLLAVIRSEAKDIHDKYIGPPYTTDFAVMFLPFEGLYAEVVNRGMIEELQRKYRVNIAGPSTMAALLNSLQMGFKTLAIQKRSTEVWQLLGAVKAEFEKFDEILRATQQRLEQANQNLDKLVGIRTRAINRKLRDVEKLEENISTQLLGDDPNEIEEEELNIV